MNTDEFSEKVLEAEQTLYHIAKTMLIAESDCEDAVQDAILKAYTKIDTLKEEKYFKTWLVRILINECNEMLRRRKNVVSFDEYFLNTPADQKNEYTYVYQSIMQLKPKIRIAVVLHYIEGYSVDEISKLLKIPIGTVKSRLSKGRKLLKIELKDEVQNL